MAPSIGRQTGKTVCVMDASSRIGAALVDRLLHRGYNIHAAAFGCGDGVKAVNCGESKRVRIFRSDPLDYHSIADAVRGCSGVFYAFDNDSYDEFMVEVEMRAAHNVLEACAQADTVEKVVFTSSVTAVIWKESRKLAEDFDERDWSDLSFCRKFKLWHALAKTLSEKTAWALAMDRGVNMVAVNAGLLVEPKLSPSNPYLKGAPEMYEDGVFVTVELKLLIDAHICIFESTGAFGRYLCFNHAICRPEDAVKLAQLLSPSAPSPPSSDELRVIQERIHSKKLNKLMLEFGDGLQVLMHIPPFDLPPSVFSSAPMVANFSVGSSTFDLKAIFKSPPCTGLVAIPLGGGVPLRSSQAENVPDVLFSLLPNQEAEFLPLSRMKMGENPPANQRLSVVEGLIFNLNNQVFNLNNQVGEIYNLRAELTASRQFLEANRFSLFHSGAEFMLRSLIKGGHISTDILNDPSYKFWIGQP